MKKILQFIVLAVLAGPILEARADKFSDPSSYKAARVGQVDSTEVVQIARRLKSLISPVTAKTRTTTGSFSLSQAMKRLRTSPISLPIPGQKGLAIHSHMKDSFPERDTSLFVRFGDSFATIERLEIKPWPESVGVYHRIQ